MSQPMHVRCKDCGQDVPAEQAYHAKHQGFRCPACQSNLTAIRIVLVVAVLGIFLLVKIAGGH